MTKKIGLLALLLTTIVFPALADNFVTIPHPTAIFDTTTSTLAYIGTPGNTAKTAIPTAGVVTAWTALQTFLGGFIGPKPVVCGATCTASVPSRPILLNLAAGSVATLPAATGSGAFYPFIVSVTTTSVKDAILTNGTDTILGLSTGENANAPKTFAGSAGTFHSIQMPFAGTQPSGGFAGDEFVCQDIAATVWECNGTYQAGTTPTTPYIAATS